MSHGSYAPKILQPCAGVPDAGAVAQGSSSSRADRFLHAALAAHSTVDPVAGSLFDDGAGVNTGRWVGAAGGCGVQNIGVAERAVILKRDFKNATV